MDKLNEVLGIKGGYKKSNKIKKKNNNDFFLDFLTDVFHNKTR